jgi:hypothetical protein
MNCNAAQEVDPTDIVMKLAIGHMTKTHSENKPFMLCSWFIQNIAPRCFIICAGSDQGVVQYKRMRAVPLSVYVYLSSNYLFM